MYLSEPCLFFPSLHLPPISQPLPCSFIMSSHVEVMICEPTSECMHCGNDPLFHTWASCTRPYEEEISPADTRRSHLLCSFFPPLHFQALNLLSLLQFSRATIPLIKSYNLHVSHGRESCLHRRFSKFRWPMACQYRESAYDWGPHRKTHGLFVCFGCASCDFTNPLFQVSSHEPQWSPLSALQTTTGRWVDPSAFLARNAQLCLWLACVYLLHVFRSKVQLVPSSCWRNCKYPQEIFMALVVRWMTRRREINGARDKGQVPAFGCFYFTLYSMLYTL